MPFAISSDIVRSNIPKSTFLLRSHLLHPHDEISIIFLLRADQENIISILEDHLLESISSTEWKKWDEEADFSFVTEKYNHFLKNIREEDIKDVEILFAIIIDHQLIVSSIGKMCAILLESNESLSIIHETSGKYHHFESVSSGSIPNNSAVFLTSEHLEDTFGEEFYDDAAKIDTENFESTLQSTLSREVWHPVHIVRVLSRTETKTTWVGTFRKRSQWDIIRNKIHDISDKIDIGFLGKKISDKIHQKIRNHNQIFMIGFLWIGVILFFGLISILVSTLFQASSSGNKDTKNEILQAKDLIDQSQELTSNPEAFSKNIEQATAILNNLKKENVQIKDTQDLLARIDAMKKEMYDIQTVDLTKKKSLVAFNPKDISPLGVFEFQKKLNIIWKNASILDYAPGSNLPPVTPYPTNEEGIDFTSTEDGNFYILTADNRILGSRANKTIDYVNVMGQDGWEKAQKITTFNDNLYLTDTSLGEIYRHKPGVNGFSQKVEVGDKSFTGIIDIGVDGWFYILHNKSIERILSGKAYTFSNITLNKIPGTYEIQNLKSASLIVSKDLKYTYILDGTNIWIFQPDSKNMQDIKAWNYIAQLNLNTTEEIRSMTIPTDGTIYVTTNLGVYDIHFEVSNESLIIR